MLAHDALGRGHHAAMALVVPGLLALVLVGSSLPYRMHHSFDAVAIVVLPSFSALPLHHRPRLRGVVPVANMAALTLSGQPSR